MTGPRLKLARLCPRALTLAEAVVAIAVVAVALPALLETQLTIRRMDASQLDQSLATHLGQSVLETIHYRMYNGHRTDPVRADSLTDPRGFKLNDPIAARAVAQQRDSHLRFFTTLSERDGAVVASGAQRLSSYFPRPAGAAGESGPSHLDRFRIDVDTVLHGDDPPLAPRTWKLEDEPYVDLAGVSVSVRWSDARRDQPHARSFRTRYTRDMLEVDLNRQTKGPTGEPVPVWRAP